MGVERYFIEAVVREGRSHREVARSAGVSRASVTKLVARYHEGGELALEPRSRRPGSCPHAVAADIQSAILELRQQLDSAGYNSGPHTIRPSPSFAPPGRPFGGHHLAHPQTPGPDHATQPHKRPRCSFVRFKAALPSEMWQINFTHWRLADGSAVEILNYLDDQSRLLLTGDVFPA